MIVQYSAESRRGDEDDVAAAVIVALDAAGYALGNGLTIEEPIQSVEAKRKEKGAARRLQIAGGASATFTLIMRVKVASLPPISEVIRGADFRDGVAKALVDAGFTSVRGPVEVSPELRFEQDDGFAPKPSPPPTAPPPSLLDTPGSNVNTDGSVNGFPIWVIVLCLLLFLCFLWPFLCFYYAQYKYGAGNERTWARYTFSHSNPTHPFLYTPSEERERLRKQLYNEAAAEVKPATVEDEASPMMTRPGSTTPYRRSLSALR